MKRTSRGNFARFGLAAVATVAITLAGMPAGAISSVRAEGFLDMPQARAFIDEMAARHDFRRAELEQLFASAKPRKSVLQAISRPAEAKPWYAYRPIFLTLERIEAGGRFWDVHREALERAEQRYGVPPEVIVAIIGVETRYGRNTGRYPVLDAVATLAFQYPKRAPFFRSELEQFLLLAREEGLDPAAVKGSYAGAMGWPQFIASSYRNYAVDFDGDGIRDLLSNPVDAIGSVANYLSVHGWQPGRPVARQVGVNGAAVAALVKQGLKPHTTLGDMRRQGLSVPRDLTDEQLATLIRLENRNGEEFWVGLQNFYAITRYNHSALYAMAVYQLSQEFETGESQGIM